MSINRHVVTLGRIDYMNVAPIYYGIDGSLERGNDQGIRLVCGPPNTLNRMMMERELDISPVSSAAYARNAGDWLILPDLAIACHERVLSVLLVSRHRLEDLCGRRILVTDESSSGRDLCRLIFDMKDMHPEFVVGKVPSPSSLPADIDAALVIGDAALSHPWKHYLPCIYDLGSLWWQLTGLPFVFAVWAVRKDFARQFPERVHAVLSLLKTSRRLGQAGMNRIVEKASIRLGIDPETARLYYRSLVYDLNDREKQGLALFYKGMYQSGITDREVPLRFFTAERDTPILFSKSAFDQMAAAFYRLSENSFRKAAGRR
jgi:chorismate dehydratase